MCWLFRARPPGCERAATCTTRVRWWVWPVCARTATTCTARWTSTTSAPAAASPPPSSWSAPSPSSSTNLPLTASSRYCHVSVDTQSINVTSTSSDRKKINLDNKYLLIYVYNGMSLFGRESVIKVTELVKGCSYSLCYTLHSWKNGRFSHNPI